MIADNDNQPIRMGPWLPSAARAIAVGAKHYFTGLPCVHGHIQPRHASNGTCLECTRLRVDRWMVEHPETAADMKQRALERQAADYAMYPTKYAENARKARALNPELFKARERAARLRNPEGQRVRVRNRRARIRGNEGTHTAKDVADIAKRQKFKCAECGVSVKGNGKAQVDHVMPIALGGSNWPANLQILCAACNQSKNAKHPIDFAQSRGRLL